MGLNKFDVDVVLFVGGMICMLIVCCEVSVFFEKEFDILVNFDEVVVMGVVV